MLSVRFEVGVSLLLAPARAGKRDPKAPFPPVENAGIQPVIRKRVNARAPAGAGSYLKTLVIWSYDLKRVIIVKSVIVWNASFCLASHSFKNAGPNNSWFSIAGSIEASVLEVITSRKLHHVLHPYKHEATHKVKIQTGFNRTIPWQNVFSLTTTVNRL